MLGKLRKYVNEILPKTVGKYLSKIGLTPNAATTIGFLFAILAPTLAYFKFFIAIPIMIVLSGLMDVVDGAIARATNKTTKFGAYLDSLTDRISDMLFFLALIFEGLNPYLSIIALGFSEIVSYARSKGELLGIKMEGIGLLERSERLILLFVASILALLKYYLVGNIIIVIIAILGAITVYQRSYRVKKALND
ncbi:phosphatidylglycerophosphate synthase [Caldisphaera lagunensis DSM 15908]|uniref:Archaetidylinositol phosphate synthase n=1 Tax=Caldisphaera lagunensis (strain DSM 15908 / JCM 11604 / ANMR 0165 / IC-154) TaxID=1056495 RepID=L0AA62_CALLD|nr:archaetidylinositol phosphate synthase [Caldisphaera lagunensis]AFZ70751.1 phosphatidylglycerophosphate synthase [Caldisphaera lagunensis DSM 15908]